MASMNPLVSFETPKGYRLQGAWLGQPRAKIVYIFIHGLTGNLFSRSDIAAELAAAPGTACLVFNNRGHGYVSPLRTGKRKALGGTAHEVFAECRDDIAGAVSYAKSRGARRIILVGHSTGCQKAVFYLARKPDAAVGGAVLLAPLSDYAGILKEKTPALYKKTLAGVRSLAKKDPHALLPDALSPVPMDAQRWLSLYTPESAEEIFTYASGRAPKTLRKTRVPLIALFASDDQYADRPTRELAAWFTRARPAKPIETFVVEAPDHGFTGKARIVADIIEAFTPTR